MPFSLGGGYAIRYTHSEAGLLERCGMFRGKLVFVTMRLIVLANREPLRQEDGRWQPSVGGLTTALLPVLERQGGVWIAWGEKDAEAKPRISYPADDPRLEVRRLHLNDQEVAGYYYGFSNRVLWPLCHYFTEQMELNRGFYQSYKNVNKRFAEEATAACQEDDLIWVQDYHLMLVPELLRQKLPDARIGFFLHIPWPADEVWQVLPWAKELTEGLLGADLIGFHTEEYAENFLDTARLMTGATVRGNNVIWNGRTIRAEVYPIGIDTAHFDAMATNEQLRAESDKIRRDLRGDIMLLGIDRLDYTKGVPERLQAFEHFLETNPQHRGRVTLFQISAPSRTRLESYQKLRRTVDEIAGRINGVYTEGDWIPVHYLYRNLSQEELVSFYLAADVMLVTPVRDGMNLVAEEFAYTTERGALILSKFAGAHAVLGGHFPVNPYDIEGIAHTLARVLTLSEGERHTRAATLKRKVSGLNVHDWAERFLSALP